MADIQGFLTVVTLDGTVVTAQLNDVSLSQSKNVMSKPTMDGTGDPAKLVGQKSGTLSASGQVDTVGFQGLEVTWGKSTPVAFEIELGDGSTVDGGSYAGNVTLTQFDVESSADDTWNFTLAGDTDSVVYTLPA